MRAILLFSVFCAAWLLLVVPELPAQSLPHRSYSVSEGLASSTVFRILQDSRGFMWFGTKQGVSRFDGRRFENMDHYKSLYGRSILGLAESSDGTIWINSYDKNIHCFRRGRLWRYPLPDVRHKAGILQLAVGADDAVWMRASNVRLLLLQQDSLRLMHSRDYRAYLGDSVNFINSIYPMPDGALLVSTDRGVFAVRDQTVRHIFSEAVGSRAVHAIEWDNRGNAWLGLEGEVCRISLTGELHWFSDPQMRNKKVQNLRADSSGGLWLAGEALGLMVIQDGCLLDMTDRLGLRNVEINDLLIDREQNVWVATFGAGVKCIPEPWLANWTVDDGLSNSYVHQLAEGRDGRLWVGTFNGLNVLDGGSMRRVRLDQNDDPAAAPLERIEAMTVDSAGKVWVSMLSDPVYILDQDLRRYPHDILLADGSTTAPNFLYTDPRGRLFASPYVGMIRLKDDGTEVWEQAPMLADANIHGILHLPDDTVWIASSLGAVRVAGGHARHFRVADGLPSDDVQAVCRDSSEAIWLATARGLARYDGERWTVLTTRDGLSHNYCRAIVTDPMGQLWVGSTRGLNYYDGKRFVHYTSQRGLIADEILRLLPDSRNLLWIGTAEGLSCLPLNAARSGGAPPQVYITSVQAGERIWREPRHISVPYDSARFSIDYAGMAFRFPDGLRFQYQLLGLDTSWRETSAGSRDFTQPLPPGRYTFAVRASLDNSGWSETPAKVSIRVYPPWWQTVWFRVLLAFMVLGVLLAGIIIIAATVKRRERARLDIHNQMLQLEQQALNSSINPHFLFNALNSIQYFFNKRDALFEANMFLSKFGKLIRLILEDAQKEQITLEQEIKRLTLYLELEEMRLEEQITFTIDIGREIDAEHVKIPVMIIQPFVENAIWHGVAPLEERGEVSISIKMQDSATMYIEVRDDGMGIDNSLAAKSEEEAEHNSQGMALTSERLKLLSRLNALNISLSVQAADAANLRRPGTLVRILITL